jgi:hypothetical protein
MTPPPSSPSWSPSEEEEEHRRAHAAAREKWKEYIHEPLDPATAAARAKEMASALKPLSKRKYDAMHNADGGVITRECSENLVEQMVWKGHWKKVMGESWRSVNVGRARTYIMEFLVPRNGNDLADYLKEIHMAGYDHYSLCGVHGWEPFELPGQAKGWGKECTDAVRLADWHAERAFSTPMPHHAGDGWVCRGQPFTKADYPRANEHGPHGSSGPGWHSIA